MYYQYKNLPEFNRVCVKATRDRAYQLHMDALKNIRPSVDTRAPVIPQTIGRNYKRYENESERNRAITIENRRLLSRMNDIQREEHYPRSGQQRPYTLMGRWQKEQMMRITHENRKLLSAVQERKPTIDRNDWRAHRLDHEYQITKMSEFKRTIPMDEIIRQEALRSATATGHRTEQGSRTGKSSGYSGNKASSSLSRPTQEHSEEPKPISHLESEHEPQPEPESDPHIEPESEPEPAPEQQPAAPEEEPKLEPVAIDTASQDQPNEDAPVLEGDVVKEALLGELDK
jgi:hypothetical protein